MKRNKYNDRSMRYGLTNIEYLHNILVYPENTFDLNPFMDRMKKQNMFQDKTQNREIAPILVRTILVLSTNDFTYIYLFCFLCQKLKDKT